MKTGIITFEKKENRPFDTIGSSRIRGRWLWQNWEGCEEFHIGQKYDVVIFQKVYWLDFAQQFKGIKIFDICDPDWQEERPVVEMMGYCDAITTSTEPLAEYLRKFTDKPIIYVPDRIDLNEMGKFRVKEYQGKLDNVMWFGYSHNASVLEKIIPWLSDNHIKLTAISDEQIGLRQSMRVEIGYIKYEYPKVNTDMLRFQAAILPQYLENEKEKYKSNNKDITCWTLGIPVIKIPSDIDRFNNPDERRKEAEQKYQQAKEQYDISLSVNQYKEVIENVQRARQTTTR